MDIPQNQLHHENVTKGWPFADQLPSNLERRQIILIHHEMMLHDPTLWDDWVWYIAARIVARFRRDL